jgi:hypothetical protein
MLTTCSSVPITPNLAFFFHRILFNHRATNGPLLSHSLFSLRPACQSRRNRCQWRERHVRRIRRCKPGARSTQRRRKELIARSRLEESRLCWRQSVIVVLAEGKRRRETCHAGWRGSGGRRLVETRSLTLRVGRWECANLVVSFFLLDRLVPGVVGGYAWLSVVSTVRAVGGSGGMPGFA